MNFIYFDFVFNYCSLYKDIRDITISYSLHSWVSYPRYISILTFIVIVNLITVSEEKKIYIICIKDHCVNARWRKSLKRILSPVRNTCLTQTWRKLTKKKCIENISFHTYRTIYTYILLWVGNNIRCLTRVWWRERNVLIECVSYE